MIFSTAHFRFIVSCLTAVILLLNANTALPASLPDLAEAGERAAVMEMLAAGADVNTPSVDGTTALHWAVYKNDLELVEALLKQGADPDKSNDYHASPMTVAAVHGDFAIMKALVDAGGDIESPNTEGQTLLMAVARTGNTETARLLLERGANVNAVENWGGQTALMWAASQKQPQMVKAVA